MFSPGKMVDRNSTKLVVQEARELLLAFSSRSDYGGSLTKALSALELLLQDVPQVCFYKIHCQAFSFVTLRCATLKCMACLLVLSISSMLH